MTRTAYVAALALIIGAATMVSRTSATMQREATTAHSSWQTDQSGAYLYLSKSVGRTIHITSSPSSSIANIRVTHCASGGHEAVGLRPGTAVAVNGCQIEVLPGASASGTWALLGSESSEARQ